MARFKVGEKREGLTVEKRGRIKVGQGGKG